MLTRDQWNTKLWWPVERRFWRLVDTVQHPREHWGYWRKWRARPRVPGTEVIDCRYEVHTVVAWGDTEDDLILDDGSHCSWMHCCDPVEKT